MTTSTLLSPMGQRLSTMSTTYVVESAMEDFLKSGAAVECLAPFSTPTDTLVGVACLAGSGNGQLIEVTAMAVT